MLSSKKEEDNSSDGLRERLNQLNGDWQQLESLVDTRNDNLAKALQEAEAFGTEARAILDWLPRIEDRLRMRVTFTLIFLDLSCRRLRAFINIYRVKSQKQKLKYWIRWMR